jgi:hypothetical protein
MLMMLTQHSKGSPVQRHVKTPRRQTPPKQQYEYVQSRPTAAVAALPQLLLLLLLTNTAG